MTHKNQSEPSPVPKMLLKKPPKPRVTRTDQDRVMMIIGVCLLVFFIVVAVFAVKPTAKNTRPMRYKGPVEDPFKQGLNQWPGAGSVRFSMIGEESPRKDLFV